MTNLEFYLEDGVWRRRAHVDVPPGATPSDPSPPTGIRKLQIPRLSVSSTPITAPPTSPSWPGDPGDGNYYVGWALGPNGNVTIPQVRTNAGFTESRVSVIHSYSNVSSGISTAMIDAAIAGGYIPSHTFKMPQYSQAQIAAGEADAAIDANAAACMARAPHPIWLCYNHEPENDANFNISGQDYNSPTHIANRNTFRAASRRIALRYRAAGVTNVMWMPIFMNPYTFQNTNPRDWRHFHPDWIGPGNGTGWADELSMDVMGMDSYNPFPWNVNQEPWYQASRRNWGWAEMWEVAKEQIERPGYPVWDYVVPEFGMSNAFDGGTTGTGPDWRPWATQLRDYSKAERIKAIIYWDNSDDLGRWSFAKRPGWPTEIPDPDLNGTKKQGWDIIQNAATVFNPPN